jgi:competence protein ComEC
MQRPLLVLAAAAALGCCLGGGLGAREAAVLLLLASCAAGLALATRPAWAASALCFGFLAVAAAAAAVERAAFETNSLGPAASLTDGSVEVAGVALRDAMVSEERVQLLLRVERMGGHALAVPAAARITVGGEARSPDVLEGDLVRAWTSLRPPRTHATPGAADGVAAARRDGVAAFGYCKSARLVSVDEASRTGLARARAHARRQVAAFVPGAREQGLVRAMLIGDRAGLDAETLERFRAAGTYHVLALSGAQVAIVAGLLLALLRGAGVGPGLAGPAAALSLAAYAAFVGGDAPVVRAAIMGGVVLLGRSLELDGDATNLLGLAGLVLLLRKPSEVADPGFQLSFVATLGLLLLTEPIRGALPALPGKLDLAVAGSLAAQLALAPLLVVHFHRLAPAAIVLNLVAVPLSTLVLLLGALLAAVTPVLPALGPALGTLAGWAAQGLLASGAALDLAPGLDVRAPDPWPPFVVTHALAVALLVAGRRGPGLLLSGVAVVGLGWGGPAPRGNGRLEIAVLDVGQGDAIAVRSPGGRYLLVDAGGSFDGRFDVGESVVSPFLWRRGVRRLDLLVLTHAHPDHAGGAPRIARNFRPGLVWEGPAPAGERAYAELAARLDAAGAARLAVRRGACVDWDGVRLDVLGPAAPARPPSRTRNDDSLVVRLSFGAFRMLLTGDVEAEGERVLRPGPVAALKVAHHGSRTSTTAELLARTRPQLAVISAGARNPFGHPAPEVVGRLGRHAVRVFRTDVDGAVLIETDGNAVHARSEGSRRDENFLAVMQLRASDDVLPSGTCRTF